MSNERKDQRRMRWERRNSHRKINRVQAKRKNEKKLDQDDSPLWKALDEEHWEY